jgi:hypothetical protein
VLEKLYDVSNCVTGRKDTPRPRFLLASLLYLACIFVFFHPNLPTLTTNLIGPPENNMQDLWNVWYSQQLATLKVTNWFFTRLLLFPEGTSLLYHSFSYTNLVVIRLIRFFFQLALSLPVLVGLHNGMLLASFWFSGLGAFYLAFHFTKRFWPAWIGGFIFAFSPFHFAHSLHHMHVATIQYIPLFVLCMIRLGETQEVFYGVGAVIWFTLGALSSWYYLFYNLFFLLFAYLYRAIEDRKVIVQPLLFQAAAVGGGSLVLLSPLLIPMILVASGNPRVYEGGQNVFVADLLGLFIFHPYHWAGGWVDRINLSLTGNPWEMSVYLGVFNISVLLWALLKRLDRFDSVLRWCIWGMLFFTLFAGGRYLHVYGETIKPIALPTKFLEYLPFFRNVRTPSRAIVYTYLFLGIAVARILTSASFERLVRFGRDPACVSSARVLKVGFCLAVVLDFVSINHMSTPITCPPAYAAIRDDHTVSFGILNLPIGHGDLYMMYQLCHGRPVVQGTVSRKLTKTLVDFIKGREVTELKELFRQNQVKYIVVHNRLITFEPQPSINLIAMNKRYRRVYQDSDESVFEVY